MTRTLILEWSGLIRFDLAAFNLLLGALLSEARRWRDPGDSR
jgi:hypothetical protein